MGERLSEDVYSYHWEDSAGSMESRYWNFVLDNYISCANEIYNHCLTSQNIHHTREMIALTQNYSYDFANLIEFINIRRLGINVPRPRRNTFSVYSGNDDEIQSIPTHSRRLWKSFRAEELVRKKKRGKNLRTAAYIPSCRNDLINSDINLKDDDLFKITTDLHQPIQIQPQRIQRTVQEQTWAQVIPQVPQLSVPHYHVPYTNFVHYPMGNFVTHQLSQSYGGNCHSGSNHSQIIAHANNDKNKEVINANDNISSESMKSSPLVIHTGVQVEITVHDSNADHSNSGNLEETQVNLSMKSPLQSDVNECVLVKDEISIVDDIGEECQTSDLLNVNNSLPATLTPPHLDDNVFTSNELNNPTFPVFPAEVTTDNVTLKSSYKEVLIKGLSSPAPHVSDNISEEVNTTLTSDQEGWQTVNNKKKALCEPRTYQTNRSLSPIIEEDLENKQGKKSLFSKAIRRKQNTNDILKTEKQMKISKEEEFKKTDCYDADDGNEWRNVVLKGLRKTRYDKKNSIGKSNIESGDSTFRSIEIFDENIKENLDLIDSVSDNTLKSNDKNTVNIEFDRASNNNNNEKIKRSSNRKKRFPTSDCSNSVTLDDSSVDIKFSDTVDQRNYNENTNALSPFTLLETGLNQQTLNFSHSESETSHNILDCNILDTIENENEESMKQEISDKKNIYLDSLRSDNETSQIQSVESFLTPKIENSLHENFDIFDENDFIIGNFDSVIDAKTSPEELEKILKTSLGETFEEESDATKLLRETEAKQQQAHEKRLQLLQCKTARVREQVQKVEEAKAAQYKLALQRKSQIDLKLKKAEENRNLYLSIIRKKAHDEEEKLKEIAFINELEAQNRRHDSLALRQEHEERLQTLFEERQRKVEEKAAKEAAVEERRRVLEAERQEKLKQMKEKRRRKEEIIDRKQQEKEKERLVIAREKAREREERLQARQAAQLATLEELQKRIQQKQEESARRHEENIELIRQKALEIGLHRSILDDVSSYHICYKLDDAEVQGNIPKDKMKANLKRRCKKIRSRLSQRGEEFVKKCSFLDPESSNFGKVPFVRHMLDLSKYCVKDLLIIENNVSTIERILTEVNNNLENKVDGFGPHLFIFFKGFLILESWFEAFICLPHTKISPFKKMFCKMCLLYNTVLKGNEDGIRFSICSNNIMKLVDTLSHCIDMMKINPKHYSILTENILCTCELALKTMATFVSEMDPILPFYRNMTNDTLSYLLTCGLTCKITEVFQLAVINEGGTFINLIPKFVQFLSALLDRSFMSEDVIRTLKSSDCIGTVPLLYEGLQKMNSNSSLPFYTKPVINLLLLFAKLDISAFQETLGAEGMGLQVRAIASFLMTYCSLNSGLDELLQAVIEIVGYFAVHNKNNQSLIQSGQQPTILQQLVSLPFKYFCDFEFKAKLFPTLVVCSYNNSTNRAIVENECSYKELELFLENSEVKKIPLLQVFFEKKDKPEDS
ncbi:hypothetical protein O3M35_003875 [Rhynocoris fuscipes]|uniref:S phase cyclin A-associated protein in the endoplasmic reticulum N-terminal domain-containing protein n=1 Tax=Rhynocoris fuscipes TaxID=488301 RepID=A0AAW1CKG2_9HEMI